MVSNIKKKNIILTGFMGTGKTTVGRLLAAKLGFGFVDTDDLIEARHGLTIPEIFNTLGEATFRQMEADIAQELAHREAMVISTGGRLMLDAANAAVLSKNGHVFCLVATPEEILARLTGEQNQTERPLLAAENPAERIVELLQQRAEGYGRFPQVVTSGKSPAEVTNELIERIQRGVELSPDLQSPISNL